MEQEERAAAEKKLREDLEKQMEEMKTTMEEKHRKELEDMKGKVDKAEAALEEAHRDREALVEEHKGQIKEMEVGGVHACLALRFLNSSCHVTGGNGAYGQEDA